ncbi:MAG: GTPase ObgE [Firmicutes bacterium]|nr:GTPase ObgE [Bacillota bacterium]
MFVDIVNITIRSGNGGNGCVSFRREKFIAAGGPDGGDGGNGGNVIIAADENKSTLMDFRYKKKYAAQNGQDGKGSKMFGKKGEDLIIKVPAGTIVRSGESGGIIADLSEPGSAFVAAYGGKGGWGNVRFATPTRQAPNFAKSGKLGRERELTLELKLIADVGLIGFPNVGKSTLLSVISDARPKIENYHFTTLVPNLGVVRIDNDASMVVADIPGIIEGAHTGLGLGTDFLRHIERTRLLIHVVDVSGSEGRNPIDDFEKINQELRSFSKALSEKPQIIAANKVDITEDLLDEFLAEVKKLGFEAFPISAAANKGIPKLIRRAYDVLKTLPIPKFELQPDTEQTESDDTITVKKTDGVFVVEGESIYNLINSVNFDDSESLGYFQRSLIKLGVIDRLEKAGVKEGDTVRLIDFEFDYIK